MLKEELLEIMQTSAAIEFYRPKFGKFQHLSLDYMDFISDSIDEMYSDTEDLPIHKIYEMDEEDYNSNILCNCGEVFTDFFNKGDIVTVVVLK